MLTPENLEKLILQEKVQCESWLWDQVAPSSELISPLKDLCRKRFESRKGFWQSNFILLVGKSLTPELSVGLFHFACLCELMAVSQSLKQEALQTPSPEGSSEAEPETSFTPVSSPTSWSPSTLHLISDALLAYVLEHMAGFNLPRMNEQFSKVARCFSETELLGLHHLDTDSEHGGKPETYKALAFKQKPSFLKYAAEGAARICGTNLVQTQAMGEFAEQISMGLSLLREITHDFPLEESTLEWLKALGAYPFRHLSSKDRYVARVKERFFAVAEPNKPSLKTPSDEGLRHRQAVLLHIVQEAYVHLEKAFSILVTMNSLHNQTPLLAVCEFSMGVCHRFENTLKKSL